MKDGHDYLITCAQRGDMHGVCTHTPHSSQCERNHALWLAALKGEKEIVQHLLDHGADPQDQCCLALSHAAGGGHIDIVRILLPLSNMTAPTGNAVAMAAFGGKVACLNELLLWVEPSFDATEALMTAQRALHIFQTPQHQECVDILIAKQQSSILSQVVSCAVPPIHVRKI